MNELDAPDLGHELAPAVPDEDDVQDAWGLSPELSGGVLFNGDEGELTVAQRRCLVALLKQRYISSRSHPEHWAVLIAHRGLLTSRLNDLFLTLHVDDIREVAYKRQAISDDDGARFPTLLHDISYSREETVLLVVLRERLQMERAAGAEIVSVDVEDLRDAAAEFRAADATDIVGAQRRVDLAIESLVRSKVLAASGEHRYEISPVLDSLLPLERLRELLDWLRDATGIEGDPAVTNDGEGAA